MRRPHLKRPVVAPAPEFDRELLLRVERGRQASNVPSDPTDAMRVLKWSHVERHEWPRCPGSIWHAAILSDELLAPMRIAIYENLPPGGAKRASFELGRYLAQRHQVDLYRLTVTDYRAYALAPLVNQVYAYPFAPLGRVLEGRMKGGHYAPRSYTLFGPLRRLHRRIAADVRGRGYDLVLAHTDAMTQSPYLLRWLKDVQTFYYCQEVLRIRDERVAQQVHRRHLGESPFPIGTVRVLEDLVVRRRLVATDAANTAAARVILVNSKYSRERVWAAYGRNALVCYLGVDAERFRPDPTVTRRREVLSIGAPALYKGHDLVIEVLSLVPADPRPPVP